MTKWREDSQSSGQDCLGTALFNTHKGRPLCSVAAFDISHSWWFLLFTVYSLIPVLNQQIFVKHCLGVHSRTLSSVFQKEKACEVAQSCPTLCSLMDCSLSGSSVHGIFRIFQARILAWVAMPFTRGSSWPRDGIQVSCTAGSSLLSELSGKPNKRVNKRQCRG